MWFTHKNNIAKDIDFFLILIKPLQVKEFEAVMNNRYMWVN